MHDKILILDFGSQVTQLIARRVREAHVYCEIHPNDVSDAFIREFAPKAIILSGSHASTYEDHELRAPQAVWEQGVPVLGICYGMFTMAVQLGGQVEAASHREFGYAEVRARGHTRLLNGIAGLRHRRGPRHAQGLDEPRRQGHRDAAGLQADGQHAELPDRRHGGRGAWLLRRAVPPRGHAHRERARTAEPLRARHCRRAARLGDGRLCRRGGGTHPRAGGQGRSDPRPVGRCGLERGRGADPPRHRRPADLRLRRPWPAAPERRRAGDGDVRRPAAREGGARRRERAVPGRAQGRERPGSQSARSSAANSSRCSRPRRASSPRAGRGRAWGA